MVQLTQAGPWTGDGFEAIREYSRLKSVVIDHSGTTQDSFVMRLGDDAGGSDN